MKSIAQKLEQLTGMVDTKDLTDWQNRFVKSVNEQVECRGTTCLSDRQIEILEEIHGRHFA